LDSETCISKLRAEHVLQAFKLVEHALFLCDNKAENQKLEEKVKSLGCEYQPIFTAKVISEASMLIRTVLSSPLSAEPYINANANKLYSQVVDRLEIEKRIAFLHKRPWLTIETLTPYIHLRQLGYQNEIANKLLNCVCSSGQLWKAEQTPTQIFEAQWLYWLHTATIHPDTSSTLRATCLGRGMPILGSVTEDIYAFTHCLLFLTDLGIQHWQGLPREKMTILSDARLLLITSMDYGNYDLAAELLWAWPILGLSMDCTAEFFYSTLCSIQGENGYLPGPYFQKEVHDALSESLREHYIVTNCYHSTVVMGILASLISRASNHMLQSSSKDEDETLELTEHFINHVGSASQSSRALALIPSRFPKAAWEMHLTEKSATRLAPMFLDIALKRAMEYDDASALIKCFDFMMNEEIVETQFGREALDYYKRITFLAKQGFSPEGNSAKQGR